MFVYIIILVIINCMYCLLYIKTTQNQNQKYSFQHMPYNFILKSQSRYHIYHYKYEFKYNNSIPLYLLTNAQKKKIILLT